MTLTPQQQTQVNQAADSAALGFPIHLPQGSGNDAEMQRALEMAMQNAGAIVAPAKQPISSSASDAAPYDFYGGTQNDTSGGAVTIGIPPDNYDMYKDPQGQPGTVSGLSWLQENFANYGLVIFGALLALGALLISQRGNVQTVVETVGKVAAVAA